MGLFEKKSTFRKFLDSITMAVYDNPDLGPEFLEQLEESLVMADVGIETSDKIIKALNKCINEQYITKEREIRKVRQLLSPNSPICTSKRART